ncbi:organic solute transporter subunit alpha-like [Diadema setosum]|uniref:organic solute transporter subunit alpha-like n=1 Tax=Diadema setosum TaxID=31175 RepID=UPI003B3A5509
MMAETTMVMTSYEEVHPANISNATMGPVLPACWPILIDPTTSELLATLGGSPKFLAVLGSAIALTVFTVGIYLETLWFVCRKIPSRRKIQLSMVMGIYPIFSITSLLGMIIPRASVITGFTAHLYFSVALVHFIMLLTGYYGDRSRMLQTLEGTEISLATPPLSMFCICCLPKIPVNKYTLPKFVKTIRGLVLQIAIIKPLFYFLGAILWLNGTYIPGDFSSTGTYLWFNVIYIVSTLFALNGIIIFYKLSREPLKEFNLTPKFLTVQFTLILTNVQSFTIGLCAITGKVACTPPFHPGLRALYIDNMLNIIEMFLFNVFATAWYRRLKGNIGQEQLEERLSYSRLGNSSFRSGDHAVHIPLGDENDNKPVVGGDSSLYKLSLDSGCQKQNGSEGMKIATHNDQNAIWKPHENEQTQPFLHVVASQPNGDLNYNVAAEPALNHANRLPQGDTSGEHVECSSVKSGSHLWSGSGSDRETDV